jgi:N-acetylglucosaminyldiphosphoundecaprenol N-acetyl-beta-D-mannosaminyltransferase
MHTSISWDPRDINEATSLREADANRVAIGHAFVDNCTFDEVCAAVIEHARKGRRASHVITPNAQHVVLLNKDYRLRRIYERADLVVPDGISLLLAARIHGCSLKERVAGVDVFKALCILAASNGLKVFFLGGLPGSAVRAAEAVRREAHNLIYDTCCPPLGFENSPAELDAVADAIKRAKPDILFVALGAPKQEYWIHDHGLKLAVPVSVGVGGSFEMVGGVVPRAPKLLQKVGCEWLYRLSREPRRMWRRYLIGNFQFLWIVLLQRVRRTLLEGILRLAADDAFAAELDEIAARRPGAYASLVATVMNR